MARHPNRPATYRDIKALPPDVVGEIVDGELIVSPRPAVPHSVAASALSGLLVPTLSYGRGGPGGWWILYEPELDLGPDVLIPDLAGWKRERMAAPPRSAAVELSPDWVCEILSPSTERDDRTQKLRAYRRHRIGHVWFVNPNVRMLEVFRFHDEGWLLLGTWGGAVTVRAEPFESIDVDLLWLWGGPRTSEDETSAEDASLGGYLVEKPRQAER